MRDPLPEASGLSERGYKTMRSKIGRILNRILAVFLAFSICVTGSFIPAKKAEAGLIGNVIMGKWKTIAINTVRRTVAFGLSKAANATDNDSLAQVLLFAEKLAGGSSAMRMDQTLQLVKKISAELDSLYNYTITSNSEMINKMNQLISNDKKAEFIEKRDSIQTFSSYYERMLKAYDDLFKAMEAYTENPTDENRNKVSNAYYEIYYDYYEKVDVRAAFTNPLYKSSSDGGFLATISPYDQYQSISTADDISDSSKWNRRPDLGTSETFLSSYYEYLLTITDLEPNVYESMKDAAQYATNAAYLYLQAYRNYCEFASIKISTDASLTDKQKLIRNSTLWNDFREASCKLERGLNQMLYLYNGAPGDANVFGEYMRGYDLESKVDIKDYVKSDDLDNGNFWDLFHRYDSEYNSIEWYMEENKRRWRNTMVTGTNVPLSGRIYQFRMISDGDDKAYAIRQSDDEQNFRMEDTTAKDYFDVTSASLGLMNLLSGTTNGYNVPRSISDLSGLYGADNASNNQNSCLTDYIAQELAFLVGQDNLKIPKVTNTARTDKDDEKKLGPNFMLLHTPIDWVEHANIASADDQHRDFKMTWANASQPESAVPEIHLDLEDDIRDHCDDEGNDNYLSGKDMVIMYQGYPTSSIEVSAKGNGITTVTADGKTLAEGTNTGIKSGKPLSIKVKPSAGSTVSYVRLTSKVTGEVIEDILGDDVTDEATGSRITAQEYLETMETDNDGNYEFTLPVPYQDVKVEVAYKDIDPSRLSYSATIHDVTGEENGQEVLYAFGQFGSHDMIGEKTFNAGDYVIISATGYNNMMPGAISIYGKDGIALDDVEMTEITSQFKTAVPTERLFAFIMPAQDIDIDITIAKAHTVSVSDSEHISHSFDVSEDASKIAYLEGTQVSIDFTPEPGYFLSKVDVFHDSYNEAIPVDVTDGGISFEMPGDDITVKVYEEREDVRYKLATLDTKDDAIKSLNFLDRTGHPLNVWQRQIKPGTEVSVKADTKWGQSVNEVILKDDAGNAIDFAKASGELDKKTGVFSFVMPTSNTVISVTADDTQPEDISSETDFYVSQPDDVVYNGSEQKQQVTLTRKNGTVLKEGRDYIESYSDALNVGTVTVTLTGIGRYTGTRIVTYRILPEEQEIKINENPTKVYDGTPVENPQVTCSSDAEVQYSYYDSEGNLLKSNPRDAGNYTVKASVPAWGIYEAAEASMEFTIIKALTTVDMKAEDIGDIAEVKAVVLGLFEKDGKVDFVIEHDGVKSEYSSSVSKTGEYYTATLDKGNIPAGEYNVTAVYESETGNFSESERTRTFKERKRRSINVNEWFEKAYGDKSFKLGAKASETTGNDVWNYEVVSDSFVFYPLGTANAAAEPSVVVNDSGQVSVKHAGKSIIKITLSESIDDPVYQETEAYVTVYVEKAPLTVTSFAMPAEEAEGFLDDVTYGLSYSGLVNGDTRKNFTHGFGSLEPVPVRTNAAASEVPYSVGIQKNGVTVGAGGRVFGNVFISRDYDISFVYGTLKVISEPAGKTVAVKSAAFDETELKLLPGGHTTLKLTVSPKNCTNTGIVYRSSNESVVSVHPDGLLMAEGKGEAYVSAIVTSREGKHNTVTKTARCHVTVIDKKAESVFLDRSRVSLRTGETVNLKATVYPEDAADADITWESGNIGIAEVAEGAVTGVSEGETYITARAGNAEAQCRITVIKDVADEDMSFSENREDDELWAGRIPDYIFTGAPVTPEPRIYYGNRLLAIGTDYTLSYADNTDAGKAYVTVAPKGDYAFEKTVIPFEIKPADISKATASPAFAQVKENSGSYTEQKLIPEVRFNGRLLKQGRDFDLSYPDKAEGAYRAAGTFRIIIKGKGNFDTASELGASQVLYAKDSRTELSKAKVRLKEGSTIPAYDPAKPEKAIEPQYELYYVVKNNGVKTETVLKEGSDYTCLYTDNTKPGKAKVIFTAEKDSAFAGSKTQTFKIGSVKTDIGKSDSIKIEFPEGSTNPYLKGGVKPEVRVMNGSILLKEGSDYTLKYSNNNAVAGKKSPKVTVKGKGYYKGKKEAEFTITAQSLSLVYPVVDDFVYSDKADAYKKVKLKLYDQNGKQLSNKDYMITGFDAMSSRPKPGSIVTVRIAAKSAADKGSGLYSGSISTSFRVIEASQKLSSVRFYIAPRYYKGDPVFLSPGDISASTPPRAGNLSLTGGSDYEIVYYENNDAPGTARVILKGVGAYGGLKTVSFRINKGK